MISRRLLSSLLALFLLSCSGNPSSPVPDDHAPVATITSPADSSAYVRGDTIDFVGSATDAEDGTLSGSSLVWASDLDGELGTGDTLTRSDLSIGVHQITLVATDKQGVADTATVSIRINADHAPVATITSPADSSNYVEGDTIDLVGSATDAEDGTLSGSSLVWASDIDGELGTGDTVTRSDLSAAVHQITLVATDRQGVADTASIHISVSARPSLSQSVALLNYVDLSYKATLTDVPSAIRDFLRNDTLISVDTIQGASGQSVPYSETILNNPQGASEFILSAPGVEPDTVSLTVPDYPMYKDTTKIDSLEEVMPMHVDSTTGWIDASGVFHEHNPDDKPIQLVDAESLDGKVDITRGDPGNAIQIYALPFSNYISPDSVIPTSYSLVLTYENNSGDTASVTLEGKIFDDYTDPANPADTIPPNVAFTGMFDNNPTGDTYVGYFNGDSIVHVMRLTNDQDQDLSPIWSPDGTHLIWMANGKSHGFALYETTTLEGEENTERSIALQSNIDIMEPVWCSNNYIYFNWFEDSQSQNQGIGRIHPDGTGLDTTVMVESISANGNQISGRPTCSPDGSQIAYVYFVNGVGQIDIANSDGSNPRELTGGGDVWDPYWSPTGGEIAFASSMNGSSDLYTINPDGTGLRQITFGVGAVRPAISPDGTNVMFDYGGGKELGVVGINGGAWKEVFAKLSNEPAWRPPAN